MQIQPGTHNLLTDVDGLWVGQIEDVGYQTGVTAIVPQHPTVAAVDVRGGGPGTRETDILNPTCIADQIHGLVFSGGSAFGLAAADGAMRYIAEKGRGFSFKGHTIPIVPAAICFDLHQTTTTEKAPYADLGYQAVAEAKPGSFTLGNHGAGYAAKAGYLKGGIGSASFIREDSLQVAALAVVNSYGSVTIGKTPLFHAWPYEWKNEFGGIKPSSADSALLSYGAYESQNRQNTTLAVVATNYALDRNEAKVIARMAHDGMARAIDPVHTYYDGDIVFALSTGLWHDNQNSNDRLERVKTVTWIGRYAAYCLSRSVGRAVYEAKTMGQYPSYRDNFKL